MYISYTRFPFVMTTERLVLLFAAVLAVQVHVPGASAIRFDVDPGETMCVSEEVMRDELAVGEYNVPFDKSTGLSEVSIHVTGPTPLKMGGSTKTFYSRKQATKGKFALTGLETGSHKVCFHSKAKKVARVELAINVGVSAKDFETVAKKVHLNPLEAELNRLLDSATEIHDEQLYMRSREEELRNTNESTADRIKWFSVSTIIVLLVLGAWQIMALKSFFKSKKLVD